MSLLEIKNYTFFYPKTDQPALSNIDLRIEKGQFLGIAGPSGAGKSTLIKIINGIIPNFQSGRYQGQILLNNEDTRHLKVAQLSKKIGSVFDDPESQTITMEVEQEIIFTLENMGVAVEEIHERAEYSLSLLGLNDLRQRETRFLSGGQKQRLAIAAAIAMKSEILLLDEPLSELDLKSGREIINILAALNKNGTTIIMAEQNTELMAEFADRMIIMNQGTIVMDDAPQFIFHNLEAIKNLGVRVPLLAELILKLGISPHGKIPLNVDNTLQFLQNYGLR